MGNTQQQQQQQQQQQNIYKQKIDNARTEKENKKKKDTLADEKCNKIKNYKKDELNTKICGNNKFNSRQYIALKTEINPQKNTQCYKEARNTEIQLDN